MSSSHDTSASACVRSCLRNGALGLHIGRVRGGGSGPGTRRESVHGGSVAASMPPHGPAARPTAALSLSRCPSEERGAKSEERRAKGCLCSFCSCYFEAKMQCAACRDAPVPLGCANNDEAMST
ncbi:hypothetical protein EIQ19_02450 [Xanthomonas campestris pv. campestris]